jgi:hypothetical protein
VSPEQGLPRHSGQLGHEAHPAGAEAATGGRAEGGARFKHDWSVGGSPRERGDAFATFVPWWLKLCSVIDGKYTIAHHRRG